MLDKNQKFSLPEMEEKVLEFWKKNQIFEKSLKRNDRFNTTDRSNKSNRTNKSHKFIFYEGPPTANGRPGIHHVLARAFKDIVLRYKTMRGFFVPRRGGWDTHGLPVEIGVEKELGLKSKKDIERYGIAAFNRKCKESVWRYKEEWEKLTDRIGFWLDLEHPYITYDNKYIETIWWILKEIWKKKLLYKGYKVCPWCTRCGTVLSSHELALGYKEVEDTAVYVKFKVKAKTKEWENTSILSWTTTPWTLPGNVALAVNPKHQFICVPDPQQKNHWLVLEVESFRRLSDTGMFLSPDMSHSDVFYGKSMIGIDYEPLFKISPLQSKTSYKIYPADFVTTTDGTGVVHTAVMYGEDDYRLGQEIGLPQIHTVHEDGKFINDVKGFESMYVKSKETEEQLLAYLQNKNVLFKTELYKHEYPFCWRCSTPLLYYARDSWFIAISKLKKQLLAANEKIAWIPDHLKHGRFGEWLKDIKDWAISRERYWGTPLPFWQCEGCGVVEVVGSFNELDVAAHRPKTRYIIVRHGEAENNVTNTINAWPEKTKYHLTEKGRIQVSALIKKLRTEHLTAIFSSDITRTKETAQLLADGLGIKKVFHDARLREINTGSFNGCHDSAYHGYFANDLEKFTKRVPGGEALTDVRTRLYAFVQEVEEKYAGKTVLVVSHEYPLWMFEALIKGWSDKEAVQEKHARGDEFIKKAESRVLVYRFLPRDETGLLDVHRPYLDELIFPCAQCRKIMRRVPEVLDVWFDSGAMPFASTMQKASQTRAELTQTNAEKFQRGSALSQRGSALQEYPADYIAEGIDQTRGWFYTLLALGVLMGKGAPYKNVISLGLILDKNGQKMSKSKGNVVDPWVMIQKYGVDVARWYFYTVNSPGEPKKFDEADLGKVLRQFVMMIYNCWVFYDTYADKNCTIAQVHNRALNILDEWVLARLHETIDFTTKKIDHYEIMEAARKIEEFVGDLSRWYIRRSRRRLQKPDLSADGKKDYITASQTLGYVLLVLSELLAPFLPFFSEGLFQSLRKPMQTRRGLTQKVLSDLASVHLEDWPDMNKKLIDEKLLEQMAEVRRIAGVVLAKRAEAKIKVRQPLASLKLNSKFKSELLNILKDEVNVKKIMFDRKLNLPDDGEIELDTNITHELKEEGLLREFVRIVQEFRQDAGLEPKNRIVLMVEVPEELNHVLNKFEMALKKEVGAKTIEYRRSEKFTAELKTKLEDWEIWVGLRKING